MSSIIEKVEIFIQRLHDLDYAIAPEATKIWYYPTSTSTLTPPKKGRSLADSLANAITEYEGKKCDERSRVIYAHICLIWVNRAFSSGVIKEGQGLARKLKECQEKNAQLERDIEKLSIDYLNLQRQYEEFTKRVRLPDESDLENER